MTGTAGKTTVLYIGGYSRSGSTLLLRLLGEHRGFVAVGELFDVWERSYIQNQLCGCGKSFRECDFWTDVTVEAFGCKPGEVPASELNQIRSQVQGHNRIPMLWRPELRSPGYQRRLHDYAAVLDRVYAAMRNVADSTVIVDSSKVPQYAWVLAEAEGIELHVVHLVRDSRATAFSWQRQRLRPEITSRRAYMDKHSVVRSATEWNVFNYLLHSRRKAYASYTVIRYEDLVTDHQSEIKKIIRAVCGENHLAEEPDGASVTLGTSHTASGNPGRFLVGETKISVDAEWMHAMPTASRLIVTGLTAPSLARYHYPLLVRRARTEVR
jgi:Sulfotransferase family